MSKARFTKLPTEIKYDAQGRRLCRFCPNPVPKGRRTWCSQACVDRYLIQSNGNYARRKVWLRDKGVCALCGTDTDAIRAQLRFLYRLSNSFEQRTRPMDDPIHHLEQMFIQTYDAFKRYVVSIYGKADMHYSGIYWQADHIKPVIEDGGEADLDQLRTLCSPCHKAETAKLAARRAAARRAAHDEQHNLLISPSTDSAAKIS